MRTLKRPRFQEVITWHSALKSGQILSHRVSCCSSHMDCRACRACSSSGQGIAVGRGGGSSTGAAHCAAGAGGFASAGGCVEAASLLREGRLLCEVEGGCSPGPERWLSLPSEFQSLLIVFLGHSIVTSSRVNFLRKPSSTAS